MEEIHKERNLIWTKFTDARAINFPSIYNFLHLVQTTTYYTLTKIPLTWITKWRHATNSYAPFHYTDFTTLNKGHFISTYNWPTTHFLALHLLSNKTHITSTAIFNLNNPLFILHHGFALFDPTLDCLFEGLMLLNPSLVWWNDAYNSISEKLNSSLSPTSGHENLPYLDII